MSWLLWLAPPVLATAVAALWSWLRGRPKRAPRATEAIGAHQRYLDSLTVPARGTHRVERGHLDT